MNKSSVLSFLFYFLFTSFNVTSQDQVKIKILKGLFTNIKVDNLKSEKFVLTVARNKFATIPLSDTQSKVIKLRNGLYAFAFNIFLAEKEDDYKNMISAGLYNFMDISPKDSLWHLTENERLIQVIIFDLNSNKFIAKAQSFPVEKLKWRPTGMGDLTQYESLTDLKIIDDKHNSFYIRMDECPDCEASYYFFKPAPNKLTSSEKFTGCFDNIRIENDKIVADKVTNCYEVNYDNETPKYKKVILLN